MTTYYVLDNNNNPIQATEEQWKSWKESGKSLIREFQPGPHVNIRIMFYGITATEPPPHFIVYVHGAQHICKVDSKFNEMFSVKTLLEALVYASWAYSKILEHCPHIDLVQTDTLQIKIPTPDDIQVYFKKNGRFPGFSSDAKPDTQITRDRLIEILKQAEYDKERIQFFADWTDDQVRAVVERGQQMTRYSYKWDYLDKADLSERLPDVDEDDLIPGWYHWDSAMDYSGVDNLSEPFETEIDCLQDIDEIYGVSENVYQCYFESINGIWPWAKKQYDELIEEIEKGVAA